MISQLAEKVIVACDLGGTRTRVGLINTDGKIKFQADQPTSHRSSKEVISGIIHLSEELMSAAGIDRKSILGVGIGVPGMVEYDKGLVVFSPHLPLRNTFVKKQIADHFSVPIFVDNDATLAVMGEKHFGQGKNVANMIMLTIGTGIGGGIIINGEVYRGSTGSSAEIGHMVIDINGPRDDCGNNGCLEVLASGDSIGVMARQEIKKHPGSKIMDYAEGSIRKITGEVVARAAKDGDQLAQRILREIGRFLGVGLTNLVNIFNPELIVIGGGVIEGDTIILTEAKKVVSKKALQPNRDVVKIVPSKLGNSAGLLGAAALVLENID